VTGGTVNQPTTTCPDWCILAPHDYDDLPWEVVDGVPEVGLHHFSTPVAGVEVALLEFRCGAARRSAPADVSVNMQDHVAAADARKLAAALLDAADMVDRINEAQPVTDAPVVVEVHPTSTPARDLPLALVHDVALVLRAHGLDPELLALSSALYRVIEATPVERGGLVEVLCPACQTPEENADSDAALHGEVPVSVPPVPLPAPAALHDLTHRRRS